MAGNKNPQELLSQTGRHEADLGTMKTPWDTTYGHGEQNPPDAKTGDFYGPPPSRNRNQWDRVPTDDGEAPGEG